VAVVALVLIALAVVASRRKGGSVRVDNRMTIPNPIYARETRGSTHSYLVPEKPLAPSDRVAVTHYSHPTSKVNSVNGADGDVALVSADGVQYAIPLAASPSAFAETATYAVPFEGGGANAVVSAQGKVTSPTRTHYSTPSEIVPRSAAGTPAAFGVFKSEGAAERPWVAPPLASSLVTYKVFRGETTGASEDESAASPAYSVPLSEPVGTHPKFTGLPVVGAYDKPVEYSDGAGTTASPQYSEPLATATTAGAVGAYDKPVEYSDDAGATASPQYSEPLVTGNATEAQYAEAAPGAAVPAATATPRPQAEYSQPSDLDAAAVGPAYSTAGDAVTATTVGSTEYAAPADL